MVNGLRHASGPVLPAQTVTYMAAKVIEKAYIPLPTSPDFRQLCKQILMHKFLPWTT